MPSLFSQPYCLKLENIEGPQFQSRRHIYMLVCYKVQKIYAFDTRDLHIPSTYIFMHDCVKFLRIYVACTFVVIYVGNIWFPNDHRDEIRIIRV